MYFLSWIVLGAGVGLVTWRILRDDQYSLLSDLMIGVTGAVGGGVLVLYGGLLSRFEIASTTLSAILGAVVLTAVIALINGRKRYA